MGGGEGNATEKQTRSELLFEEKEDKQEMLVSGWREKGIKVSWKGNKTFVTILLVGKQSARTGNTLPNVCQGAQVGLLGLVPMLPQQRVHDLLLRLRLQQTRLDLAVCDHLCGGGDDTHTSA